MKDITYNNNLDNIKKSHILYVKGPIQDSPNTSGYIICEIVDIDSDNIYACNESLYKRFKFSRRTKFDITGKNPGYYIVLESEFKTYSLN